MRVLHVGKYYYPYRGGMENHLRLLAAAIKDEVDLDVLVSNSGRVSTHEVIDGVRVTRCFELAKMASTSLCPTMPLELARRRYDVLHLHFPHPMAVASYLAVRPSHPHKLVVTYHGDVQKQKRLLRVYGPLMGRVLERADSVVCTSPNYLEASDTLAPHRKKCVVIPLGIDRSQFARSPRRDAEAERIRARFPARQLVLGVGRLVYYKGFEYVVRAMRDVDAELVLVGDGPLKASLERVAAECGVASRVHFVGEVKDEALASYYFAADVYALPSVARSEAFALVQLEAMACRLPVVNTSIPGSGVSFVSRDGESGLTVPPADAAAFATALRKILKDTELARRFGDAGYARVEREFSKEVMAERTLALYRSLCGESERRPPAAPYFERAPIES